MGNRSTTRTSKELSKQAHSQCEAIEPYVVKQPGSNPPTVADVNRDTLVKITTNADDIVDALIKQAAEGHYQAAHFLLTEMNRLDSEQQELGERSAAELLRPIIERLAAKYREEVQQANDAALADAYTQPKALACTIVEPPPCDASEPLPPVLDGDRLE